MKPRVTAVSVVLVAVVVAFTLFALPFLFLLQSPAEQFFGAISTRSIVGEYSSDAPSSDQKDGAAAESVTAVEGSSADGDDSGASAEKAALEAVLTSAATRDKTVIITTLNQAWATKGTMIDLFLESFHKGEGTRVLLKHLVIVALDQRSFERCRELHRHCLMLKTAGVDFSGSKGFMSTDFLRMMWRRMSLLRTILELGYNFVFTDADILWLRNPFEHFANRADFQISCDKNRGGGRSVLNKPNCGYQYARSSKRTINMFRHWCREGDLHPDVDEQTLFTRMLRHKEFAAYQRSNSMSRVVTMHANCCTGLDNKVQDLRTALNDWEAGKSRPPAGTNNSSEISVLWHVPSACRHSLWPSPPPSPPDQLQENRET